MPITLSGLLVNAAISVIEIDDVLLASIASALQLSSSVLKIFFFTS
jgi:hypothetical protein